MFRERKAVKRRGQDGTRLPERKGYPGAEPVESVSGHLTWMWEAMTLFICRFLGIR